MQIAGIAHIPNVIEILRETFNKKQLANMELVLSARMRVPGFVYILSDKGDMLMIVEPLGSDEKAQVHLYTKKSARGKGLVRWVKSCLKEVFKNTSFKTLLGFTPKENKAACRFNRLFKFRIVGTIEHDSGVKEVISMITKKEVEAWE